MTDLAFARRIGAETRAVIQAIPEPVELFYSPEPAGTEGRAYGYHPDRGWMISFATGRPITRDTSSHEHVHLAEAWCGRAGRPNVLREFYAARWGPTPPLPFEECLRRGNEGWGRGYEVREHFADAGKVLVYPDTREQAGESFGRPYPRAEMEAFFAGLPAFKLSTQPAVSPAEPPPTMFVDDPIGYLLSFKVNRGFGDMSLPQYGRHTGVDLALPADAPVYAIGDGIVVDDDDNGRYDPDLPSTWSGISVQYRLHRDGALVTDAHMRFNTVASDQQVRRGQLIGYVGSTGASTGPHLHHEIRLIGGQLVDPITYMRELQEEEDMAYTEDDRKRAARIEGKLDQLLHIVSVILPGYWLQRLYWALPTRVAKFSPWQGPQTPAAPPEYLTRLDPPDGSWRDPLLRP